MKNLSTYFYDAIQESIYALGNVAEIAKYYGNPQECTMSNYFAAQISDGKLYDHIEIHDEEFYLCDVESFSEEFEFQRAKAYKSFLSRYTQKIISKIEDGEYTIERRNECGCSIDWTIDGEELRPEVSFDACWFGNILVVDGEDIAQHVYGEGFEWLVKLDAECDEFEDIEEKMQDELSVSDSDADGALEDHDEKSKNAIIKFLEEKANEGFKLMRNNERGFANEYECILVSPESTDEIDEDWDELEPEEWASEFLYEGDAMTQAFNSFRLI